MRRSLISLQQLILQTEKRLKAARLHYGHGTDNPRDEAAFLVLRGLKLSFDADLAQTVDPRRVEELVKRRIEERTPVAYLLNEAWLSGVPFYVDRRVIIPRSHIAELLPAGLEPWLARPPARILDLCTGSGCLAVLAARAFPLALVDAGDLSTAALGVARRNVSRHRLEKRIRIVRSDLFSSLGEKRYDLIVTNPPYVTSAAMRRLPAEYRHEPGLALAAGKKGLDVVARILREATGHLSKKGLLVCEVGDGRGSVEKAWPRAELYWPRDEVFIAGRDALASAARTGASRRTRSRRARASR
ncbi:MAG TPA: 50S ribosomal protein L3 N(5)-glutamine methyltransferase [Burkholderiales bacterium]|nr:50S ribosomal protein L3 N(5)-glutamine methyltransferase [Burkholderiales bacterium]